MGTDENDDAQSKIPLPIRLAKEALTTLATQYPALAASLAKRLPGFAMQQANAGVEVTVEYLLEHAKNNKLDKAAPKQQQKSYEEIIAQLFAKETAVIEAAARGDLAEIKRLKKEGADIHYNNHQAYMIAAENGRLDVVKYYTEKKNFKDEDKERAHYIIMKRAARRAIMKGQREVEDYFGQEKEMACAGMTHIWFRAVDPAWVLEAAALRNDFEAVKYLVEERGAENGWALRHALEKGYLDIARYLIDRPFYAEAIPETVLEYTAQNGPVESMKFLLEEKGLDVHAKNDWAIWLALNYERMPMVDYLVSQGATGKTGKSTIDKLEDYRVKRRAWRKVARVDQPYECMGKEDPAYYRPKAFKAVRDMLKEEGADYWDKMTLHAAALFGTEDRVLQYLEKHGQPTEQPLHDIIHMIRLPDRKTPGMNLKAWGDAVLKCGPSMARLVKFADKLPEPLKSDDGRTWSMLKTRNAVAQFAYERANENLELAALCLEYAVDEYNFNKALELTKEPVPEKNIPEVTVDGADFGMPGATFRRLEPGDVRGLFLGEITDCCQSIGGQGEQCARNGFTSEDSGFYVVENSRGKIVGETWAWRGRDGELVFDSLETLGRNVTHKQWRKLAEEFAQALTEKPENDVTALHIGTGGATSRKLVRKFSAAASPAEPRDGYQAYRDSRQQVVIWHTPR